MTEYMAALAQRSTPAARMAGVLCVLPAAADADLVPAGIPRRRRPAGRRRDAPHPRRAKPAAGYCHPGPARAVGADRAGGGRSDGRLQLVAGRFQEALCLAAGEAIEARASCGVPVDPRPVAE
ncbi:hypothetical protein ACU4GD_11870 [Cupriavidus basilensis]